MTQASTALKRIAAILDDGSFAELGEGIVGSGVITGFGTIDGRPVCVFSQDPDVNGGAVSKNHAEKIIRLYKVAIKTQTPVLGLIDTAGVKLDEGAVALSAFGKIFRLQSAAKGYIPQVFAVYGECGGSMAISAGFSDFLFSTDKAKIFVVPPAAREYSGPRKDIDKALDEYPAATRLGYFKGSEGDVAAEIRKLYSFLPLSDSFVPEIKDCGDDLNRVCAGIEELTSKPADLVKMIADDGEFAAAHICRNHAIGLIRLGGEVTAVIANAGTPIKARALDRFSKFVKFAADFGLPLVTLVNTEGFSGAEGQEELLPVAAANLAQILAGAKNAKVCVVTGKDCGSAYTVLNSRGLSADFVYAWDSSDLKVMDAEKAVRILYAEEIEKAEDPGAFIEGKISGYLEQSGKDAFVQMGFVDKIIQPCDTRKYLIGTLQMLANKAEF